MERDGMTRLASPSEQFPAQPTITLQIPQMPPFDDLQIQD
jgi:hypothetical protein